MTNNGRVASFSPQSVKIKEVGSSLHKHTQGGREQAPESAELEKAT